MYILPLAFVYGFLAASASLLLEVLGALLIPGFTFDGPGPSLLVVVGLIEECCKVILFLRLGRSLELPKQRWPIIFGFSSGFFGAEFALIHITTGPVTGSLFPIIGLACLHFITSAMIIFWIWPRRGKRGELLLGIGLLGLFHAVYNILVTRL